MTIKSKLFQMMIRLETQFLGFCKKQEFSCVFAWEETRLEHPIVSRWRFVWFPNSKSKYVTVSDDNKKGER